MMLLARLQVESTRLLNRFCAVLTEKRTGFNQTEADRYLAELMRPDIQPSTAEWILNRDGTYSLLIDGHEVTRGNLNEFGMWYPKSSAASNPPGASDAGPVQDPPPAPGHPDPSPTNASASCAVGGEGPAADSDIPPVAAAGQPTSSRWARVRDGHIEEYRLELENGIVVRASIDEMMDYPRLVEERVKQAQRCQVAARFSMSDTLIRQERDAALRRLGRYRDTFGPLPE